MDKIYSSILDVEALILHAQGRLVARNRGRGKCCVDNDTRILLSTVDTCVHQTLLTLQTLSQSQRLSARELRRLAIAADHISRALSEMLVLLG